MRSEKSVLIEEKALRVNTTDEVRIMTHGTRSLWMSVTAFLVGLVSGIGAGILVAPQSGARTRRHLHNLVHDLEEQAGHAVGDAKASIGRVIDRGRRLVT